jgi:hypothetical protein
MAELKDCAIFLIIKGNIIPLLFEETASDFGKEDYYGKRRNNSWVRTGCGCIGI